VIRGGSWHYGGRGCRSADRDGGGPAGRDGYVGFRVVLAPGQP
jgi:formylglycine-generating enzyme required for sulfatase activity